MSDWSKSAEDAQADDFAPKVKPPSTHATAAVLPVLQNWQVLDVVDAAMMESDGNAIEGEATVVDTVARAVTTVGNDSAAERLIDQTTATAGDPQRASFATIPDQVDPTIIVTLAERHCQVVPGEEAHYALTILNNGAAMATFQPVVEGWIAEAWLTTPLPKLALERGARQTITVTIARRVCPNTRRRASTGFCDTA